MELTQNAKLLLFFPDPKGGYELYKIKSFDNFSPLKLGDEFKFEEDGFHEKYVVRGINPQEDFVNYRLFLKE